MPEQASKDHQAAANVMTRRALLGRGGLGFGSFALASMLNGQTNADRRGTHFPAKATSVIHMHMVGAPSHLDLFDYKPTLQKRNGQKCPESLFKGNRLAFIREHPTLLGTPTSDKYQFRKSGDSGLYLSGMLPHLQTVADEICLFKTVHTEQFNHAPAQLMSFTGFERFGRPSIGAWVNYGLGTMNRNLPGFVVMVTGQYPGAGNAVFGSGFLPSVHQGIEFRSTGDPVLFLSDPKGLDRSDRKQMVDHVNALNRIQLADVADPEIATRISQYEMAFRMQASVPELMDVKSESPATMQMYGAQPGGKGFANNCLLARRLVERGVRYVQLLDQGWDHHGSVFSNLPKKAAQVDRPIAALIKDLKQRGLLESTLVVWSAEFGRTPMAQGNNSEGKKQRVGRDHHKQAFTLWMAGGGIRGGHVHGSTDEFGFAPVGPSVHVHDFNATILHALGIDHERLTFKFQGRQYRLTDVHGHVVQDAMA